MSNTPRKTWPRDRHRRTIRANHPPCAICGGPIDYTLPYLDPGEFVVDHVLPLARGGEDTIENKQAAHRKCNRTKSDKVEGEELGPPARRKQIRTSRAW